MYEQIIEQIEAAQAAWTGADWDVDPELSSLISYLETYANGSYSRYHAHDSDYFAAARTSQRDGSYAEQCRVREHNAAVDTAHSAYMAFNPACSWDHDDMVADDAVEQLEAYRAAHAALLSALVDLVNVLGAAESAVESEASRASEHGDAAIAALREGEPDIDAALFELGLASQIERQYGDALAWGPVLTGLESMAADDDADDDDDDDDDDEDDEEPDNGPYRAFQGANGWYVGYMDGVSHFFSYGGEMTERRARAAARESNSNAAR